MAKKKVTECQKLINEVDQEAREKLEKRFKEAVIKARKDLKLRQYQLECQEGYLKSAKESVQKSVDVLIALENADLDQWGKENPEPKANVFCVSEPLVPMSISPSAEYFYKQRLLANAINERIGEGL